MTDLPKIENTPGIVWKLRKAGYAAQWQCRTDVAKKGYRPTSVRLWCGPREAVTAHVVSFLQDRCNVLQNEMLVFAHGGEQRPVSFDGTLGSLIRCYQTDVDSPYKATRFYTRQNYDSLCRRLNAEQGMTALAEIKARDVKHWHEQWSAAGKVAMAHSLIAMLRILSGFGATILEDAECDRLSVVLSRMKFKMPKPRQEHITAQQAAALRAQAHSAGMPAIALAQAFQFDCTLRQKDVIGEIVPVSEPGLSDVLIGNGKWLSGLRWEEIDKNLILKHVTSKRQKELVVDLRHAAMVIEELTRRWPGCMHDRSLLPANGPVIRIEQTGLPYSAPVFRREWRKLATACGIPNTVRNMDTRAGAITEALASGARLDAVRKAATHSNSSMTQRYSRGDAEETAEVMALRVAHRNKSGTT